MKTKATIYLFVILIFAIFGNAQTQDLWVYQ